MFFVPIILGIGAILVLVWGTPSSDGRMEPSDEPQRARIFKEPEPTPRQEDPVTVTSATSTVPPVPPQTITHVSSGSTVKPLITFTKDGDVLQGRFRKKEAWTQKDPAVMHNYTKLHAESSLGGDVEYQAS